MSARYGVNLAMTGCALLSLAAIASAQTKVAVISLQKAVLESAEIKKASADMEAKYKPRQEEIVKLQTELQNIQQQLSSGKLSPQAQADVSAQGQRAQRDLQRKSDDLREDVDRERNEILGKASQKMQAIVKQLAEARGIDVVVDVSNTVYFKPALDLTNDALAAYDKAYPAK